MCALGHYLEEEGIATVAIGLIRPQIENTRPPRALWVPFELGRPFGPPNQPAFQKDVILGALRMLERTDGPFVIDEFPRDDPREQSDPAWSPPATAAPSSASAGAIAAALSIEIAALDEPYRRSVAERGRTTVGLSRLSMGAIGDYVAAWLRGDSPASPTPETSPPLALRFAADDLKAYYLEAALADQARPSSRQVGDWLWHATAAGAAFQALRRAHRDAADERVKLIAGNFLVPALRVPATG